MLRFREKLYDIARQITREDSAGRELADSVYTDLYGTKTREGERVSKLSSYRGRGSLEGWLRTVLAQEYVNTYRKQRRLVSLDEESQEGAQFAALNSEALSGPENFGADCPGAVVTRVNHKPENREADQEHSQAGIQEPAWTRHEPEAGRGSPERGHSRVGGRYSREFSARFAAPSVLRERSKSG